MCTKVLQSLQLFVMSGCLLKENRCIVRMSCTLLEPCSICISCGKCINPTTINCLRHSWLATCFLSMMHYHILLRVSNICLTNDHRLVLAYNAWTFMTFERIFTSWNFGNLVIGHRERNLEECSWCSGNRWSWSKSLSNPLGSVEQGWCCCWQNKAWCLSRWR